MPRRSLQVRPIVGMEIHVQLNTRSKMFCRCPVEFGSEPNTRVCPVCLGLPGALPVMNQKAFEYAVIVGLALRCQISRFTKWDRKSYFYPDLPKNYQISQYDLPLAAGGYFELPADKGARPRRIRIIRAHLEEDAGKNVHDLAGGTGVDLNRAGTPLLEIVTEPDLVSAEEASIFAIELQKLVTYLGVSEGNMQKAQMRFEPNVNLSITEKGTEYRTPIAEVKNLNSFRALRDAVAYEIRRQLDTWAQDHDYVLDKVGKVNCGWREELGRTEIQRTKEEVHDYRYFPDPDLMPVRVDEGWLGRMQDRLPELPISRRARFVREYGLNTAEADMIVADRPTADLFEEAIGERADTATLGRQFVNFWAKHANEGDTTIASLGVEATRMAELSRMTAAGVISATTAQTIAGRMLCDPRPPAEIARAEGLELSRDVSAVERFVDQAITENSKAVGDFKTGGKKSEKAFRYLQGRVIQLSRGSAPPQLVKTLLRKKLVDEGG
ncbi:MAG: Asp-tRNA(Asn)/Glu-tRNA(Gln) amidotransferase subunit GatB [Phycisphaerales bacterium]|nr:MAG: Asp-tRNA(Asn)/Glu-tRNA(Gln) amidotransferase subunit GatB [Phycisphaerales bacterium]